MTTDSDTIQTAPASQNGGDTQDRDFVTKATGAGEDESPKYPKKENAMTTQEQSVDAINSDDQGPELFAIISEELLPLYGEREVLHAIAESALYDSEDQEFRYDDRIRSARLHLELEQLLERMNQFEDALNASEDAATPSED